MVLVYPGRCPGLSVYCPFGALFKYGDQVGVADVIFGEEGDNNLLGAFTLEALGLALDPLRRELKPIPMILMAGWAAKP